MGEFSRIYKTDLSDRQLMGFFGQLKASGRDGITFYNIAPMDERAFARWVRSPDVHLWIVLFNSEPCGMVWLTEQQGKTAKIHFATLPQGARRTKDKLPVVVGFGLYALASVLHAQDADAAYLLDRCYGVTPLFNREAVKFIHRLGAMDLAVLPGACWNWTTEENADGLLTLYTRDTVAAHYLNI